MKAIFDLESNGLYNDATKVHCITIYDVQTKKYETFADGSFKVDGTLKEGIDKLSTYDILIGHNIIDFDLRLLRKLYGFEFNYTKVKKCIDTLILSNLTNPDRFSHSLGGYGEEFGISKPDHEDWTVLSEEMLHRNREDVKINVRLYEHLSFQLKNWNWDFTIQLENCFRYIMSEQETRGWKIDEVYLDELIAQLTYELQLADNELDKLIPLHCEAGSTVKAFTKAGKMSSIAERYGLENVVGDFSKVEFKKLDLGSHKQAKDFLLSIGWIPTEYNFKKDANGRMLRDENGELIKASPKITEDSLEDLESPAGKMFLKRFTIAHRLTYLTSDNGIKTLMLKRADGKVGAGCHSCATNTGRVRHYGIVNVCSVNKPYGKEIRSLFVADKGFKLVGADLSALENRIAGHYTFPYDNGELAERLLSGDPHQFIADALSISRALGKKLNYAIMYGGQVSKVKEIMICSDSRATSIYEQWWMANMPLLRVKEDLENQLEMNGFGRRGKLKNGAFIKGLDGRKIFVRSRHSILNALFQSAGSIINKFVTNYAYKRFDEEFIMCYNVGNFHDENDYICLEEHIDMVKEIFNEAVNAATKYFKLNVPMAADIKVGDNWYQTH